MIRNIIELVIIIVSTTIVNFNRKVAIAEEKIDLFYKGVEGSSLIYQADDEVFLTFDYQYINEIAESTFKDFKINIIKENDTYFSITVYVKEKFLNREIKEDFYLKKGDLYD